MRIPNSARVLFLFYPQFQEDYRTLLDNDIISVVKGNLKWRRSKASLAQYFVSIRPKGLLNDHRSAQDKRGRMRWAEVERVFGIKQHLSQYVNIGGYDKPSKDFDEIMGILGIRE